MKIVILLSFLLSNTCLVADERISSYSVNMFNRNGNEHEELSLLEQALKYARNTPLNACGNRYWTLFSTNGAPFLETQQQPATEELLEAENFLIDFVSDFEHKNSRTPSASEINDFIYDMGYEEFIKEVQEKSPGTNSEQFLVKLHIPAVEKIKYYYDGHYSRDHIDRGAYYTHIITYGLLAAGASLTFTNDGRPKASWAISSAVGFGVALGASKALRHTSTVTPAHNYPTAILKKCKAVEPF